MDFWEVMKRLETGPIVPEEEFDRSVSKAAYEYKDKYEIKFEPEEPVPVDSAMADRLFEAGVELFLDVGIYCIDTRRVCKFSKEELIEALEKAPESVDFGSGKDQRTFKHRTVDDKTPPFCSPNPIGTPVREALYDKVLYTYANISHADTFSGPSLISFNGETIGSGTPLEVEAAIWNVRQLDKARQEVGRPEMCSHNIIACAEKTGAITSAMKQEFGARPTDGLLNGAIAELKVDYERLRKVAFLRQSTHPIGGLYGPLMGGYAGGPEGTAIVLTAHHFLGLMAFEAQWHDSFPIHIHQVNNTSTPLLWLLALVGQALARNTHLPIMTSCFTAAGPCTPMLFDELCAHTMVAVASSHNINPMAPARNKYPERCSGFEAGVCCEIGHVIAETGLPLKEIGQMVKTLLTNYEKQIPDAPLGKKFEECYNIDKMEPTSEYIKLYEEAKERWFKIGFPK